MNKKWWIVGAILIVFLSLLFFLYLWLILPPEFPEEYPDCFERPELFLMEDFKCISGDGGSLEFRLNTDGKEFDDLVLRFHNRSRAEFGIYEVDMVDSSDSFYSFTFPIEQEGDFSNVFWNISFVEVRGLIYDGDGDIECVSRLMEKVSCS